MKRRGVSGVVVTLLFVLLALAAVIIVWAVIRPLLVSGGEQIAVTQACLNLEAEAVKCTYNTANNATVLYSRGGDDIDFEVSAFRLIFTGADGTTLASADAGAPGALETNSFTTKDLGDAPLEVSVIAVLLNEEGEERLCEAPSTISCSSE